jgi:hypothetical protein
MRMIAALVLLLTISACSDSSSPVVTPSQPNVTYIQVRVLDIMTEKPIPGALVCGSKRCEMVDNTGSVYLTMITGNSYDLSGTAIGYEPQIYTNVFSATREWKFYLHKIGD